MDMANSLSEGIVEFTEQKLILENSKTFIISSMVFSALYGLVLIAMMLYIIQKRNHQVMKMAQAPFLAVQVLCGAIIIASLFVYLPVRDEFCMWTGMLTHVPLTILAATLVGRLWRVYSIVSVAMAIGTNKGEGRKQFDGKTTMACLRSLANFHLVFYGKLPSARRYTLRTTIGARDLSRLIFVLTLPQFILQLVGILASPRGVDIVFADEGFIGRTTCETSRVGAFGSIYVALMFLFLLYVSWVAKELPSMFNEKTAVFNTAAFNAALAFGVVILASIADTETASPDIISFVWMAMTTGIVSTIIWSIIWPKVWKVYKDEKIVVSNLLSGDRKSSNNQQGNLPTYAQGSMATHNHQDGSSATHQNVAGRVRLNKDLSGTAPHRRHKVLKIDEPPPRQIEARAIDLKHTLEKFTNASFGGNQIPLDDWEELMAAVELLHDSLDNLEFSWTKDDEKEALITN